MTFNGYWLVVPTPKNSDRSRVGQLSQHRRDSRSCGRPGGTSAPSLKPENAAAAVNERHHGRPRPPKTHPSELPDRSAAAYAAVPRVDRTGLDHGGPIGAPSSVGAAMVSMTPGGQTPTPTSVCPPGPKVAPAAWWEP